MEKNNSSCCNNGPGYASPLEAIKGPRETILYTTAIYNNTSINKPDYLAVVDVDPQSETYCEVVHRLHMPYPGDELHHMGWNSCSSCFGDKQKQRKYLVLPSLVSGNIYFVDTSIDAKKPQLFKTIEGKFVKEQKGITFPHTAHCLGNGDIVISHMGDADANNKGSFLLLDSQLNLKDDVWDTTEYGYDFWYQPYHNVMVSSEWGSPNELKDYFDPSKVVEKYGSKIYFWDFKEHKVTQTVDLGEEGKIPLEVRFAHDPKKDYGFVGAALSSNVILFYKNHETNEWNWKKVIDVEPKNVENWKLQQMPGLITDILLSMDDKYLYLSNWLQGDIRQYDIQDPYNPKLVGQVFVGGSIRRDGAVKVVGEEQPEVPTVKGQTLRGGPQMLQLSLDGKRLYVTNSLFSAWDKQFYPDLIEQGSHILQIDVDVEGGGLNINHSFFVDFGKEPYGPALAHEMRYPGGDCTSDIWLA